MKRLAYYNVEHYTPIDVLAACILAISAADYFSRFFNIVESIFLHEIQHTNIIVYGNEKNV